MATSAKKPAAAAKPVAKKAAPKAAAKPAVKTVVAKAAAKPAAKPVVKKVAAKVEAKPVVKKAAAKAVAKPAAKATAKPVEKKVAAKARYSGRPRCSTLSYIPRCRRRFPAGQRHHHRPGITDGPGPRPGSSVDELHGHPGRP